MPTKIPQVLSRVRKSVRDSPAYPIGKTIWPPKEIVKIDRNENPLGPSQKVVEALSRALPMSYRYPPDESRSLMDKIANFVGLTPEHVLLGDGSNMLIDVLVKTFIDPSDEVIVSYPTYAMYETFVKLMNGRVRSVPKDGDFNWSVDGIVEAISPKTKLVFICSPNNPTGNVMSKEDLVSIVKEGVAVLLDEAYAEFARTSLVKLIPEWDNIIVLRTFSKAFGLAGLRVGYMLANPDLIEIMKRVTPPFAVNVLAIVAAEAALDDLEYLTKTKEVVKSGREYIYNALNKVGGVTAYPSEANFVLIRVDGVESEEIVSNLLGSGILIRDCAKMRGLGPNFVRVTVGTMDENRRFVEAFKELISRVRK